MKTMLSIDIAGWWAERGKYYASNAGVFAAPEEFTAEKSAVKQESKPVLEKFVKPEQDMAPAGSFLNPYRQKAIDFSDEEIPSEKIFAKPETKDDFTLNKPLNIADSADLVKEKSEVQAAVKTEEETESSEKDKRSRL